MKKKIVDWIINFVAGLFGFEKVPEVKIDKEDWAKDAEEVIRKEQKERKEKEQKEWDKATNEEKKKKLLDRFNRRNRN